jgi:hypothetical protein
MASWFDWPWDEKCSSTAKLFRASFLLDLCSHENWALTLMGDPFHMKIRRYFLKIVAAMCLAGAFPGVAGDLQLGYLFNPTNRVLQLSLPANPRAYYTLEWSPNLVVFTNVAISLGTPGPVWAYSVAVGPSQGFFRVQSHDIFSPQDTDGDGIDDRYELQHPSCLNPLVYADASQPCLTNGMSNYQFYLFDLFGGPGTAVQFFSREASVFNFGAPTAAQEAISREATVWNFGSPSANTEANSKEVSVYNANPGSGPPATEFKLVVSREATVWNFGSPSANTEAISKEVSVYNANPGSGPPATGFNNVYSRELTVFNFGAPTATWEAISREITVLNFQDPQQQ